MQRVYRAVRAAIPVLPRASARVAAGRAEQRQGAATLRGRPRKQPPPDDATDAAAVKWRWRQATEAALRAEVHRLRQQGVALRGIARQTGLVRRTVRRFLELPPAEAGGGPPPTAADTTAGSPSPPADTAAPAQPGTSLTLADLPGPPGPAAPWTSWAEVRQASADLSACRFLLLRRPDHLRAEEQAQLDSLLAGPLGAHLRVARAFLTDWYAIWYDADRQRRSPEAASARYQQWQANPDYLALPPLRRVQQQLDAARFAKLSQFLQQPAWEATNNGAERTGRAFRHQQAPHFTLRTTTAIDGALRATACLRRDEVLGAARPAASRCTRGRQPRLPGGDRSQPNAASGAPMAAWRMGAIPIAAGGFAH